MSDLLERPVVESAAPPNDITHFYCCDEDRSRCGLDISAEPEVSNSPPERQCKPCLAKVGKPCGDALCPNLDGWPT